MDGEMKGCVKKTIINVIVNASFSLLVYTLLNLTRCTRDRSVCECVSYEMSTAASTASECVCMCVCIHSWVDCHEDRKCCLLDYHRKDVSCVNLMYTYLCSFNKGATACSRLLSLCVCEDRIMFLHAAFKQTYADYIWEILFLTYVSIRSSF